MKRTTLLLITLLMASLAVQAQMFSPQQLVNDNANNPEVVASADINQDGYIDLFSASLSDSKIAFYIFDENTGSFGAEQIISINVGYCVSLFPADLDGDNFPDLLAVSQQNNQVLWYKNSGSNSFSLQPIINSNAQNASSVIASDIDNDGDLDVVSAAKGDNKILWYENDGLGSFSSPNEITINGEIPVAIIAADINNDDYPEIFAAYAQTNKIVYFMNEGDGNFSSEIVLTNQTDYINSLTAGDIDKDGNLDIISASKSDHKIAWYKNIDANGSFSEQHIISDEVTLAFDVEVADFDLDNDLDVVASSTGDNKIYLFENTDGNGNFILNQEVSYLVENVKGLSIADYDNDGDIDISAASTYDDKIVWFENGKSNFLVHTINNNRIVTSLAVFDINNDGNEDVFYTDHAGIYEVINWGSGEFSDEIAIYEDGYNYNNIFLVDLDGDGDKDLYATDWLGDEVIWFKNTDGNGSFGPVTFIDYYGNCDAPWGEQPEDYDNDGDLDLLVSMVSEEKFYIYENDGSGNFTKTPIIENIYSNSYCSSDINLDGNIDIVIAANDNIYYYENDGTGSFLSPSIIYTNLDPNSIIAADLTNDNYDDIIYNNPGWLENNQDGTFQSHDIYQWGSSLFTAAGDLDNDGDIDFATAARNMRCVYFAENINAGEVITTGLPINVRNGNPEHVELGDLTNDGYLDIIIGSWPDEGVFWAENYQFRILNQPTDQYVCENEKAYFSVLSTGVVEYQWQLFNGTGFSDISNNDTYSGANKAQLIINNVTEDMIGNQYKCRVYDKADNLLITEIANLYRYSPSIICQENQNRIADPTNTYTVIGDEFDLDTIYNKCNENLSIINDYNGTETLAGEVFPVGNYTVKWEIYNDQNELLDDCEFDIEITNYVGIDNLLNHEISITPNPSNGIFSIHLPNTQSNNSLQLSISNITGKVIKQVSANGEQSIIDISDQAAGIYFLKMEMDENTTIRKIIKK